MTEFGNKKQYTRREILSMYGSVLFLPSRSVHAEECPNISAAQALIDDQIQGIGVWVVTDGALLVKNAQSVLADLDTGLPAAGAAVDSAMKEKILSLAAVAVGGGLLVVGAVGAVGAGGLIVGGMLFSSGLIVARALVAPETLNPTQEATMLVAGDVERALIAATSSGPIAARAATGIAGNIIGGVTLLYNFSHFINSLQVGATVDAELTKIKSEIATLRNSLSKLDDSQTLIQTRSEALFALKTEFSVLSDFCVQGKVHTPLN